MSKSDENKHSKPLAGAYRACAKDGAKKQLTFDPSTATHVREWDPYTDEIFVVELKRRPKLSEGDL